MRQTLTHATDTDTYVGHMIDTHTHVFDQTHEDLWDMRQTQTHATDTDTYMRRQRHTHDRHRHMRHTQTHT